MSDMNEFTLNRFTHVYVFVYIYIYMHIWQRRIVYLSLYRHVFNYTSSQHVRMPTWALIWSSFHHHLAVINQTCPRHLAVSSYVQRLCVPQLLWDTVAAVGATWTTLPCQCPRPCYNCGSFERWQLSGKGMPTKMWLMFIGVNNG